MFTAAAAAGRFVQGAAETGIHPAVGPAPGDLIVTRPRVSAFAGSDLAILLTAGDIDTLVLAGVTTSGSCCPPSGRPPTSTTN